MGVLAFAVIGNPGFVDQGWGFSGRCGVVFYCFVTACFCDQS